MATGAHKASPPYSSAFPTLTTRLFHNRSTDLASSPRFSGCLVPHRSPAETSTTPCNKSTHLGISASSFCLLSLSSLPLLFQCTKMLHIHKESHCWIQAAQRPFASSSLQANHQKEIESLSVAACIPSVSSYITIDHVHKWENKHRLDRKARGCLITDVKKNDLCVHSSQKWIKGVTFPVV